MRTSRVNRMDRIDDIFFTRIAINGMRACGYTPADGVIHALCQCCVAHFHNELTKRIGYLLISVNNL